MFSFQRLCTFLIFLVTFCDVRGQFQIPDVTLEAYSPKGFRASIRAVPGIELFAFHGNKNKRIAETEPGELLEELKVGPDYKGDYITYFNRDLKLKVGDTIYYWVYVQHEMFGYRKDGQVWNVTELRKETGKDCGATKSTVSDRTKICSGNILFEDNFDGRNLDETKWFQEQYIPDDPDYEFVTYRKNKDVTFVSNNNLFIKPKLILDESELKTKFLDLSNGCTKEGIYCKKELFVMHNPIISGKIVSKLYFTYGEFEIRAKLPTGDWIYPEIYLEGDNKQRLILAYSRGNIRLTGNDGNDIGGTLLFGGPYLKPYEPDRSAKWSSKRSDKPFSNGFHKYKLIWTPEKIELYVDDNNYGSISMDSINTSVFAKKPPTQVRIVFGVGVGGLSDFPDGFRSGVYQKPWRNAGREMTKDFYEKKDEWYDNTWNSNSQLQIDYVRVRAL